jgi:hypothetical protein
LRNIYYETAQAESADSVSNILLWRSCTRESAAHVQNQS